MSGARSKQVDLKIILLGCSGVGKTSLVHRYTEDNFEDTTTTIGASFAMKQWRTYKLGIWDTAGQEKYDSLSGFYVRGAGAAILVYNVVDGSSFEAIDKYVRLVDDNVKTDVFKIFVGAKLDLLEEGCPREVAVADVEAYAKKLNCGWLETSSKTGYNVNEVFERVCCHYFREGPTPVSASTTAGQGRTVSLGGKAEGKGAGNGGGGGGGGCC